MRGALEAELTELAWDALNQLGVAGAIELMDELWLVCAQDFRGDIPAQIWSAVAANDTKVIRDLAPSWLAERDEMTYLAEVYDQPDVLQTRYHLIAVLAQQLEFIDPDQLSVGRLSYFLENVQEFSPLLDDAEAVLALIAKHRPAEPLQPKHKPEFDAVAHQLSATATSQQVDRLLADLLLSHWERNDWETDAALYDALSDLDAPQIGAHAKGWLADLDVSADLSERVIGHSCLVIASQLPAEEKLCAVLGLLSYVSRNPQVTVREIIRYTSGH